MGSSSENSHLMLPLIGMTAVTGMIDAVSFLSLGHVFTANMTGNVVFLAFAICGTKELSIPRSLLALAGFMAGALLAGRVLSSRTAITTDTFPTMLFAAETALLCAASFVSLMAHSGQTGTMAMYLLIVLTAVAMGVRNAMVRKLAVADLTTTVLTLTITGLAADSHLAGGANPRWQRRLGSVLAMVAGAALGTRLVRTSVFLALAGAASVSALCTVAFWFYSKQPHAIEAHKGGL